MNERVKKLLIPLLYASTFYAPTLIAARYLNLTYAALIGVYYLACAMLGYCLAMVFEKVPLGWHFVLAAVLGMGPVWWVVPDAVPMQAAVGLAGTVVALATDRSACRSFYRTITTKRLTTCLAIMVVSQLLIYLDGIFLEGTLAPLTPVVTALGFFWFVVVILLINLLTLRNAAYVQGEQRVPPGLRLGNMLMTVLFLGLVMLVAFFKPLTDAIARYWALFKERFAAWLLSLQNTMASPGALLDNNNALADLLKQLANIEQREYPWLTRILNVLLYMVVAAMALAFVAFIVGLVVRLIRRFIAFIHRWLGDYLDQWKSERQEYVDEEENLFSWQKLTRAIEDNIAGLRRRLTPRPRLEDQPDDAARIRLLYRWMLEKMVHRNCYDPSRTAREYRSQLPPIPEADRFVDAYNRVRFSTHDVHADDVLAGRRTLEKL